MPATIAQKRKKPVAPLPLPAIQVVLRGGPRAMFGSTENEAMLDGGAQTGKTLACILKSHTICANIPNVQGGMIRKAYNSLVGTVVRSFLRIVQPEKRGIQVFGGETPSRFIYPNGSVIWLGGMDNPARVLSSERDFIYVNQAEELTLNDWELLLTRCTGRAAVIQNPQVFGDCNPAGSKHWIRLRAEEGRLRLIHSTHKDNPTLYTKDGELTEDGAKQMAALENSLTGVRRLRLLEGIWATAEGAVYEMFDANVHVVKKDTVAVKKWMLCQDDGYTDPAVVLLIGEDADRRWHIFREFYEYRRLRSEAAAQALAWWRNPVAAAMGQPNAALDKLPPHDGPRCSVDAVDAAQPELIAALNAMGVAATPGKGKIMDGVRKIQDRLKVQGDGQPRLTLDPSCVNTVNEFESYVINPKKPDEPLDKDNHAMDSIRYLEHALAVESGAFTSQSASQLNSGANVPATSGTGPSQPRPWQTPRPWQR